MSRFLDRLNKYSSFIVLGVSLLAYFTYQVMSFDGDISTTLSDPQSYLHLLFVIYLNQVVMTASKRNANTLGLACEEFKMAEEVNNKLIKNFNNDTKKFRAYVKQIEKEELGSLQEDYLFSVGDKTLEELTKKELKRYKRLKAIKHDIYGFNLPLHYEISRGNKIKYLATIKETKLGNLGQRFSKAFSGVLFGAMTINMIFQLENVGSAFISLLVISSGLVITYLLTFMPAVFRFKVEIPNKVLLKKTLFDSYKEYKENNIIIIEEEKEVKPIEEETIIEEKQEDTIKDLQENNNCDIINVGNE